MSERYLWDRSGPVDPQIERLERALEVLRAVPEPNAPRARRAPRHIRLQVLAAAAGIVLAAAAVMRFAVPEPRPTSWQVAKAPVFSGQRLQTGAGEELTLESRDVGEVELGPNSELRARGGSRLALQRGTLRALIWAPAREFVVETPSARAVDLGCEYTITVNESGDGLLRVSRGWVAFVSGEREAFLPAGAACVTRRRSGPGIPFYEDAPETLRRALNAFESGDSRSLQAVLDSARPQDGLTLWHLLTRAPASERSLVFDRLAQLVPLPPEVTREAAVRNEKRAIDLCWNALGLENTEWWRGWERRWTD